MSKSKLDKLKSTFSNLNKIQVKSVSDIKSDLSETKSMPSSDLKNNQSDYSEVSKKKTLSIKSLNSDLSNTDNFQYPWIHI